MDEFCSWLSSGKPPRALSTLRGYQVQLSWFCDYVRDPRYGWVATADPEADTSSNPRPAPPAVQEIAWKAQARLTARYRALARRGKRPTLVVTAIARELSGFIWAVSRAVGAPAAA